MVVLKTFAFSLFVSLSTFFTLCGKIVNQLCLAFAGFILGIGLRLPSQKKAEMEIKCGKERDLSPGN